MSEQWKIDDGSQWSGDPEDPPVQVEPPSVYDGTGYSIIVDRVPEGESQLEEMEMLRRIAAALNAAPQAAKAREIIERAEKELTRAKAWVGDCYLKAPPEKAAPAMQCMEAIDQLLADIAAYKEG